MICLHCRLLLISNHTFNHSNKSLHDLHHPNLSLSLFFFFAIKYPIELSAAARDFEALQRWLWLDHYPPWCLLIFLFWFMRLPGTCYLLWPTFTFVSPINHLTVQSWGLSVAECRINSPLMHKKGPGVVTVQQRIKGNTNHMWQEPWPVGNVNTLGFIKVLTDKIVPFKQAQLIQEDQTDAWITLWNQSEWKEERKALTER